MIWSTACPSAAARLILSWGIICGEVDNSRNLRESIASDLKQIHAFSVRLSPTNHDQK